MTDREAAIERVRAYVEACDYDDREIVNTAEDCDLTAGDLRILLQPSEAPVTAERQMTDEERALVAEVVARVREAEARATRAEAHAERLASELAALRTAATFYTPTEDFGTPEEPNPCFIARIPVEFVERATAALSAYNQRTET